MKFDSLLKKISHDKAAKIDGTRRELDRAAERICAAAHAKSIPVATHEECGSLYVWRQPAVDFISKSRLSFLSK
jgi:hypothetical protein